jgi:predicted site-specific integrase-resolvase
MNSPYLTPKEVAERWRVKPHTLSNWRHAGTGPKYVRVGARVLYPIEEVLAYEKLISK